MIEPAAKHSESEASWNMKLILSRKGFDSSYGGMPSPILPDGRMLSLPIPARHDRFTFQDLNYGDAPIEALLNDLGHGAWSMETTVHLDPDLNRSLAARLPGWRPSLGQTGAAQSHLEANKVTVGDVFLFFGWFREVELRAGKWQFRRDAPHQHVIFGWLEVGAVLPIVRERDKCLRNWGWIANHPHVVDPEHYDNPRNTLYIAAKQSGYRKAEQGGGRLQYFKNELSLTRAGSTRSQWSLPGWFSPLSGKEPLSYHRDLSRWRTEGDRITLQSAAKGQEFVLDCEHYTEAGEWIRDLIATSR